MKLTAGEGQFVTVPGDMVDHYLSRGWKKVEPAKGKTAEAGKAEDSAPVEDAPSKPARRGRRKVSGESGVDATE